jgi:excisionase family DNA binding protein
MRSSGAAARLPQGFYSPAEIAVYVGMSTYAIQELCRRGELRHVKVGRAIRIRRLQPRLLRYSFKAKPITRAHSP